MALRILIDDPTDGVGVMAREHAVHHYLGNRHLPAHRLAACFEINRLGEALFGLGAGLRIKLQPLRGTHRMTAFAGYLTLGSDRLATHRVVRRDHDQRPVTWGKS